MSETLVKASEVVDLLRQRGSSSVIIDRWQEAISVGGYENPKPLISSANDFARTYNLGLRFKDVDEVNGEYEFTVEQR